MFIHEPIDLGYNDLKTVTKESGRKYTTPKGDYPSITTILGKKGKAAIIAWRNRIGHEEANKISRQASGRGTAVHAVCENYVNNDPNWKKLGTYDYTNIIKGYCPKLMHNNQSKTVQYRIVKENKEYFEKMCQSKFTLCPEGDASWSFRFYEVLMCKSLPVVESWHHTYRTIEESKINYKYLLYQNIVNEIKYQDYINENIRIFEKYHLIS